jgi:nucleoside-diphosphate-sugar epimerase
MKIAITGGSGFIGTQLCKILKEQGHDITIMDIAPSAAFPQDRQDVDVRDLGALTTAFKGHDIIYHLAAEHRDDVSPVQKYYDTNVKGGENVCKAANANNINTIIFTSTVAVYGLDAGHSTESDTPAPFNDYGHSKLDSETSFNQWAAQDKNHKLVTVRLVATFGPGNRGNIYTLLKQIADGKFIMIGKGKNLKSIAYIGNVAAFLAHMLTLQTNQYLYNYADKPDLNMSEMVASVRTALGHSAQGLSVPYPIGILGGIAFDMLAKLTGKKFPISSIRVKKFCADTTINADKMKDTNFVAPYALQDGLKDMIEAEFKK